MKTYQHHIYYNDKYTAPKYAFDTTRKSKVIANTIGVHNTKNPEAMLTIANNQIQTCTTSEYYNALQTGTPHDLAESNGFQWDTGIVEMFTNSTAGVLSAALSALKHGIAGSLSSGLHHADQEKGAGFCTVNGLAITAHWLNIPTTILDFDAHCGGGTVNTLRYLKIDDTVDQYDISTNKYDHYQEDDNHRIFIERDDISYLNKVNDILQNINTNTQFILYNAGTDPYPTITHDALKQRDTMVFEYCKSQKIACAYVLAGGYTDFQTMESLAQSHINTLDAAERTL